MRIALDTDRYVDLCKGAAETVELLETATKVVVPFAVLGELRAGFLVSRRQVENERRQLRKQGTPIPTNDMWLAALVLKHNLALHARDKHFEHLPQLIRG